MQYRDHDLLNQTGGIPCDVLPCSDDAAPVSTENCLSFCHPQTGKSRRKWRRIQVAAISPHETAPNTSINHVFSARAWHTFFGASQASGLPSANFVIWHSSSILPLNCATKKPGWFPNRASVFNSTLKTTSDYFRPAALRSFLAISVFSQVKLGSSLPKCPP